jgi:uncharacterized protein
MRQYATALRAALTASLMLGVVARAGTAGPLDDALYAWFHRDYATALRLWREYAEQGDAGAQTKLGLMYELGQGLPQDNAEALKWYHLAASHDATAQFNLGAMYEYGHDRLGVVQDYAEAFKWYVSAADQGDANAQFHLGNMYENGLGVPKDLVLAHMHYSLAAALQDGYKYPVKRRNDLEQRMSPAQIAEAQTLVRAWKPKPGR